MKFVAYIDPGMGILLWQSIVAMCLGVLFYLKKSRAWIVALLRKPFQTKSARSLFGKIGRFFE